MILRTSLSLLGFSLAIAGLGGTAGAAEKQFPATMMKNVKTDFQAKGDGVTDDTAAINLAIASGGVIYFPAGVYLVTDRIEWKDSGGGWKNYRSIQGEGKTSTVIKLKDKLPAYSR